MVQKKYALALLIFVLLAVAVFFILSEWRHSRATWQFIPANASAVITSDQLQDSTLLDSAGTINVKDFPLINQATESLSLLYWIVRDKPIVDRTLQKKNITYSFHPRSTSGMGVIVYIPLQGDEMNWWTNPNRSDIRVLRHIFQGTTIVDINDANSQPVCSYIIKDKYLIASKYGELIEDVVRFSGDSKSNLDLQNEFRKTNDSKYSLNIYLKNSVWHDLFFKNLSSGKSLEQFMFLFPTLQDYHLSETKGLGINFKSLGSKQTKNYATDWLTGQKGKEFRNYQYISQQTSLFFRIASQDSAAFKKEFRSWHEDYKTPAWDKLGYHIGKQRDELISGVGSELILCQIEGNNSISEGKLAMIEYSNYNSLRPILAKLARLSTNESNVSLDKFQGYDLYSISIPEVPSGLYGPLFGGFPKTFVSYVAPYLILSNSAQTLRNYISDYENRITWKESPELDSVLFKSDKSAQISLVANPRKVVSNATVNTPGVILSAEIESIVLQCYYDDRNVYPSLSILPKRRQTSDKVLNRTFLAGQIKWVWGNTSLIPSIQRQKDGAAQLLLTDQSHTLLRPNSSYDKAVPITRLDGPIVVNPYMVDFLNIGRQQVVLATSKTLYTLDEDESGFVTPITTTIPSGSPIKNLFRIDGGSEGSSRFIVLDALENIFLWDRVNDTPKKINRFKNFIDIQVPVVSLNQLGSRSLIVTQRNGLIYLLNEDGGVRNGFPVDLLTRIESPFTWFQNPQNAQSELVGVTTYGELARIQLNGVILERRQLYRPESSSKFKTLFDQNNLDWLLVRTSTTKVAILNKEGIQLFEIGNILPPSTIQYHYFGNDNRFISISSGGFTSIFDMNGKRLGDRPIPSEIPVRLSYQPAYYKVFILAYFEGKYQTWTIKIR